MAYSATELAHWNVEEEYAPNKWRPARPCGIYRNWWSWENWRKRLVLAYRVFCGRVDVVYWGDFSGEWTNDQVKYRGLVERSRGLLLGERRYPAEWAQVTLMVSPSGEAHAVSGEREKKLHPDAEDVFTGFERLKQRLTP